MFWNRFDFFKDFLTINWPPLSTSNFSMRSYKPVLLLMNLNDMPNYKSSNSQVQWAECHWDKLASSLPSLPRPVQRRLRPECWRCPSGRQRFRRLGQPPDLSFLSVRTQLQGTWIWGVFWKVYTTLVTEVQSLPCDGHGLCQHGSIILDRGQLAPRQFPLHWGKLLSC